MDVLAAAFSFGASAANDPNRAFESWAIESGSRSPQTLRRETKRRINHSQEPKNRSEAAAVAEKPDTLEKVIAVERELDDRLAVERSKAEAWLEAVRRELEQSKASEIAALRESASKQRDATELAAREQADASFARDRAVVDRLRSVGDAELRRLLEQRLAALWPGRPA